MDKKGVGKAKKRGFTDAQKNPQIKLVRPQSARKTTPSVKIYGVSKADFNEFIDILKQKTNFKIQGSNWEKNCCVLKLDAPREAVNIRNAGDRKLDSAKVVKQEDVSKAKKVIEGLVNMVKSRYDPQSKFLNLNQISSDTNFVETGSKGFTQDYKTSKFGPILCKVIEENCPDVQTISFDSNGIKNLEHFSTLHQRIPNLLNISFRDNLLEGYKSLEGFKGSEFKYLRELILDGNPVKTKAVGTNTTINYASRVKQLFPSIKMLDGEELLDDITFALDTKRKLPAEVKVGFMDSPDTMATVHSFLNSCFDSNRLALANFYSEQSVFSISIANTGSKEVDKPKAELLHSKWWPFNHALNTVKSADKRCKTISVGAEKIANVMNSLPKITHPITSPPEEKRFLIDAFQRGVAPNVYLHIYIHGEFYHNQNTRRSFDRTFILIPTVPGSRAAAANIPVTIINDSLVLRPFSSNTAWENAIDPLQYPQLPSDEVLLQYQRQLNLPDLQHQQIIAFSRKTGLNYAYSKQCLEETGWNEATASAAFESAKQHIPPAAFQI
ncbi:nuclear mRNA export, poly(A)+RNA binding protein [Boothiomyces sp. JEL0838]|nr:nuclear mRNA export, poly(A)+RNA binding protein [Boothiomyces sp. JEL0838]